LGAFLDAQHRRFPDRKLFVSEYGADNDARLHSLKPMMGDSTAEWAHLYHTSYVRQIESRPYLAGSAVWTQNDFGSEARGGPVPHLNTKGIVSYDRKPKDIFYYYKALLSSEPVLRVATRGWATRTGAGESPPGGEQTVTQPVLVYTNLPSVELLVNGHSLGSKPADASHYMTWDVPFRAGTNVIEARARAGGRIVSDKTEVRFIYRAAVLADPSVPFESLAVNVGSNAQFVDDRGTVWESDQPYRPGGWGHVGGVPGSAVSNVLGSPDDPLFQTLRQGLKAYRFDVPDGGYEVELRFLEHRPTKPGGRVFGIALNGKTVLEALDLAKDYGEMRAFSKTFRVSAARGQGVTVSFNAVAGDAVLSAVLIRRLR
jgi:beta-galactosidase